MPKLGEDTGATFCGLVHTQYTAACEGCCFPLGQTVSISSGKRFATLTGLMLSAASLRLVKLAPELAKMFNRLSICNKLETPSASCTQAGLALEKWRPDMSSQVSLNAASQVSLKSFWPDVLSFTGLQSLALVENETCSYIACGLPDLAVLTGLTSLWLQRGCISPHAGDPTGRTSLPIEFDEFESVLDKLNVQCLKLAAVRFNTDLDSFWEGTALCKLKHLRLDYITFDGFNHFRDWSGSASVAMPSALSRLVNLR